MKNNKIPEPTTDQLHRFWANVPADLPVTECWVWQGFFVAKTPGDNYGLFNYKKGQRYQATRVMFKIWYGYDPGELLVRHKCDNPPCVNPFHLEVGTHHDNNNDAIKRNRHSNRFTDQEVVDIRQRAATGENLHKIAHDLNVTSAVIKSSIDGSRYKHVPGEVSNYNDTCYVLFKISLNELKEIKTALNNPYWGIKSRLAEKYQVTNAIIKHIQDGRYDKFMDENAWVVERRR